MADTVFLGGFQPGGSVNIGIGDGISGDRFVSSLRSVGLFYAVATGDGLGDL